MCLTTSTTFLVLDLDEIVAEKGFGAIFSLAADADNRKRLGACGGCEVVVKALNTFGVTREGVALDACGAIAHLATDDKNNKRLGAFGGCEAVVKALKEFGEKSDKVADQGCQWSDLEFGQQ